MMKWFGWLGRITPEQRAKKEVEEIDRLLYDADKARHDAQMTLLHLRGRREFLVAEYELEERVEITTHFHSGEGFTARAAENIAAGAAIVRNFGRHEG